MVAFFNNTSRRGVCIGRVHSKEDARKVFTVAEGVHGEEGARKVAKILRVVEERHLHWVVGLRGSGLGFRSWGLGFRVEE